jgi:hypothetical protein
MKMKIAVILAVLVVAVAFAGWWLSREHNYSFEFNNSFKLPRNKITENLDIFKKLSAKGTVTFPKGSIEISIPKEAAGGTDIEFQKIGIVFPRSTTISYELVFSLTKAPDDATHSTDVVVASADIDVFMFRFSHDIQLRYGDKPLVAMSELSVAEGETDSSTDQTPAVVPNDGNKTGDKLQLSTRAKILVGNTLLQMLLSVPFQHEANVVAGIAGEESLLRRLPKIKIDSLVIALKKDVAIGDGETVLVLDDPSFVQLSNFELLSKDDQPRNAEVNGELALQFVLAPKTEIKSGTLALLNPKNISLGYHGTFSLADGVCNVSKESSKPSALTIERCDVNYTIESTKIAFYANSISVVLSDHEFDYLLKNEIKKSLKFGKNNTAIVNLDLNSGTINAPRLSTEISSIQIRDAVFAAKTSSGNSDVSLIAPKPTKIVISKLVSKQSDKQSEVAVEMDNGANIRLAAGDIATSSGLTIKLKDLYAGVKSLVFKLAGTGTIHAQGIVFEIPAANSQVHLASNSKPFEGDAKIKQRIKSACFFDDASGNPTACVKDIECNLDITGNDDGLQVSGKFGAGTPDINGFKIGAKSGDIEVVFGKIEITGKEVKYSDIEVKLSKAIVNRVIDEAVSDLNGERSDEGDDEKKTIKISKARASLDSLKGDTFKVSGSAKVHARVDAKIVPRVRMVKKKNKYGVTYWEPQTYRDWKEVFGDSAQGSLAGELRVNFNENIQLDKLKITFAADIQELHVDIKGFPGAIEKLISNLWKKFADAKYKDKINPFSDVSKEQLKTIRRIHIDKIEFANTAEYVVLKTSGTAPL